MGQWAKEHGLLIANTALFLVFFVGMVLSGAATYSEEQQAHGEAAVSVLQFLAVAVLVGASVYLREKGSPESKPVAEPHYETGA